MNKHKYIKYLSPSGEKMMILVIADKNDIIDAILDDTQLSESMRDVYLKTVNEFPDTCLIPEGSTPMPYNQNLIGEPFFKDYE